MPSSAARGRIFETECVRGSYIGQSMIENYVHLVCHSACTQGLPSQRDATRLEQ
jgi:hypothetical protein